MEKVKEITHKAKDQAKDAINEVKSGGHSTHSNTTGGYGDDYNSRSTNAGPHDSNLANKADPRVDSDRDGSRNAGARSGNHTTSGYGDTTSSGYGNTSTTGGYGDNYNSRSTNAGPHDSNLANKADPRVDSDRDGSRNAGLRSGNNTTTSGYGNTGSTTGGYGDDYNSRSTNAGPHDSNLANKADPRVDSDRDGSRNTGFNSGNNTSSYGQTTGGYGDDYNSRSTNAGPHDSNLANKADPRVDSDRDGSRNAGLKGGNNTTTGYGNTGTTTGGYGDDSYTSSTGRTTGPHSSDTANRMDPRVDSRRDDL